MYLSFEAKRVTQGEEKTKLSLKQKTNHNIITFTAKHNITNTLSKLKRMVTSQYDFSNLLKGHIRVQS